MKSILKRTWAEISMENLEHNYNALKSLMKDNCMMCAVVKADGYGHGAVAVAALWQSLDADYLAVSNVEEAVQLRKAGIYMPILILGYTPIEQTELLLEYNITQSVNTLNYAQDLNARLLELDKSLKIHIKVDTGMSRLGMTAYGETQNAYDDILQIDELPRLYPEGIYTHFAVADEPDGGEYTRAQFGRFTELLHNLRRVGVSFEIRHCCNSAAAINYPEMHLDMCRLGISIYGLYPNPNDKSGVELRPAMSLRTKIIQIKEFEKSIPVSYGRTYTTESPCRLAVIPIGYADGLYRSFSNNREVLIGPSRVPIRGRVCMDMCVIDVTGLPEVEEGDIVTVFGTDGEWSLPMDELAAQANTITYEIACSISKRVTRVYTKGGREIGYLQYIV